MTEALTNVFTARDGMVFHRGCYLPMETAIALLPRLEKQRWSQGIARELAQAIAAVSEQHLEHDFTEPTRPSIPSRAVADKETHYAVPKGHAA